MRYKLEYKKSTETAWKQLKAYSSYQLGNFNVTTVQTIANDSKYNIRASVQDKLGNTTTSIYTVKSTSKKWLEVINGETINVIGKLQVNGSNLEQNIGFLSTARWVSGDLLNTVDSFPPNVTQLIATGSTTSNIPSGFDYGVGLVLWREVDKPFILLIAHNGALATISRASDGIWYSWKTFT